MASAEDEDIRRIVVERLASHLGTNFEPTYQAYVELPRNVRLVLRRHEYAAAVPSVDRPVCTLIDHVEFMKALSKYPLPKGLFTLARLYDEAHVAPYRASKSRESRLKSLASNRNISLRECGLTLQKRPEAIDDQIFIEQVEYYDGRSRYKAVFREIAPMPFGGLEHLDSLNKPLPGEDYGTAHPKLYAGIGGGGGSDIISASILAALLGSRKREDKMDLLVSTRTWTRRSQDNKGAEIGAFRKPRANFSSTAHTTREHVERGPRKFPVGEIHGIKNEKSAAEHFWGGALSKTKMIYPKDPDVIVPWQPLEDNRAIPEAGAQAECNDQVHHVIGENSDSKQGLDATIPWIRTGGDIFGSRPIRTTALADRYRTLLMEPRKIREVLRDTEKPLGKRVSASEKQEIVVLQKTHSSTRRLLPMYVNGALEMTVPDSGSFANIMNEEYARTHRISINRDRRKREQFQNAAGASFASIGQATVTVAFPDDPHKSTTAVFSVVRGCVADVIVGSKFLHTNGILTRFKHRLVKFALSVRKNWRLMQMFFPKQRFTCSVGGTIAEVALDTGSDQNFISDAYAKGNSWKIKSLKYEQFVRLADGHKMRVLGYVDKEVNIADHKQEARFYVLPDLTCDVIFGDQLIEEVDIFAKIEETTWSQFWTETHEDQADELPECFAIEWLEKIEQQVQHFYSNPDYKIPADVLDYLNNDNGTAPSNASNSFVAGVRRKWDRRRSSRPADRRSQYDALQSGLWLKLRKIDRAETRAKEQAELGISLATGPDSLVLTGEDSARSQKHQDERCRLIALRQDLLDWRRLNPTL